MEKILRFTEKLIPKKLFAAGQPIYHYLLAVIGAIIYRFPAKKLHVIGVTGTKGKSTVVEMINAILEESGLTTVCTNTIRFKVADESRPNKFKMSVPGRFFMQKLLRDAVDAGCTHAVIEMTSEGSRFFRNKFIPLNDFVFTNMTPEHIESHGSFDKYLQAKLDIAKNIKKKAKGTIAVINTDADEYEAFEEVTEGYDKNISYSLSDGKPLDLSDGIKMQYGRYTIYSHLDGEFNVYNILAAAKLCEALGIREEHIRKGIENLKVIPGRAQRIETGQNFDVIVDYAHTIESLEAIYDAFPNQRKICVLGNTGGGRDKWKRPTMAKVAEEKCDEIIFTNEDPYDEDPMSILNEMRDAIKDSDKPLHLILDRREAFKKAFELANEGDVVLITGKGTDPYIMEADGKKTPWSDSEVAEEELGRK